MADGIAAYKILALAPFAHVPDGKFKPDFVKLDLYSIDGAVESIAPVLYLPLSSGLCSEGAVTLKFSKIKDFKPDSIVKNSSFLKSLSKVAIDSSGKIPRADTKKISTKKSDAVDDILSMVEVADTPSDISHGEKGTDSKISNIMREIFSNIEFQKMESAWRGVQNLVKQADIKGFNKISVSISPVSHNSLENILNKVESLSGEKIPNLILIDLGFDNTLPSIKLLEKVVEFADKMMIPVCIDLKPEFFKLNDFNQLNKLSYISNYLEDVSYAKFRKLKELSGASWITANCNRFAVRDANEYEDQPLSASSVWAAATLCARSVNETGWPMKFAGYNRYFVDNLPMFHPDEKNSASAQALFSDEKIIQMVEAGVTPVVGAKKKDFVFIPKETSLSGDSIKFQMFFNRILETLINIKKEPEDSDLTLGDSIKTNLTGLFVKTGHDKPEDISLIKQDTASQGQQVFLISFTPPASVLPGSKKVKFTFVL